MKVDDISVVLSDSPAAAAASEKAFSHFFRFNLGQTNN